MSKYKFIRRHADKALLDKSMMEFYIIVLKLLSKELNH